MAPIEYNYNNIHWTNHYTLGNSVGYGSTLIQWIDDLSVEQHAQLNL